MPAGERAEAIRILERLNDLSERRYVSAHSLSLTTPVSDKWMKPSIVLRTPIRSALRYWRG